MRAVAFDIEGKLPGLNEYTLANRSNKFAGASTKKAAEDMVGHYIKLHRVPKGLKSPVRVKFVWCEPTQRRDPDNIRMAAKFILDALVRHGVIKGDGQRHILGISDEFAVDKVRPHIHVIIEEVAA